MGGKSDYLENKVLDEVLGKTDYVAPATVYIALYTATPSDTGGGTEVSGGAYARAAVTNNTTNWPNASGGSKSNGTAITFAQASASWGTIVAFGIFDAVTAGNLLYWGAISPTVAVAASDTASFAIGAIVVTEQ